MTLDTPEPLPVEELPPASNPLLRKLTLGQTLLWGGLLAGFAAVVLFGLARYDSGRSTQAWPRRIPEYMPAEYCATSARELGLNGDAVPIEGQVVGAEFPFREVPVVWIANEEFGQEPSSGLPYAVPVRVLDDAVVILDGRRGDIKSYVAEINLASNAARTVYFKATVQVVGRSAFASSCEAESTLVSAP